MALLENLKPEQVYLVKVSASNKMGDGPFSHVVELKVRADLSSGRDPRGSIRSTGCLTAYICVFVVWNCGNATFSSFDVAILRRRLLPLGPELHDGDHHRRVHRPPLHHHLWFYHRLQRQKQVLGASDRSGRRALPALNVVLVSTCLFFFHSRKFSAVKNQQESLSTSGAAAGHRPPERQAERTEVTAAMSPNHLDTKVTLVSSVGEKTAIVFRTMSIIDSFKC